MPRVEQPPLTNGREAGLYDLVDLPISATSAGNFLLYVVLLSWISMQFFFLHIIGVIWFCKGASSGVYEVLNFVDIEFFLCWAFDLVRCS